MATTTKLPTGIELRPSRDASGEPSYRASVWDRRTNQRIRKTFHGKGALAAAKAWRNDALSALQRGTMNAPTKITLREAAEQFLAGIKATPPTVMNRSGQPFKPSAIRGYESDLAKYVLPVFGFEKLADIRRGDLQRFVEELTGKGHSGSKIRNVITSVRTVYRWAIDRELTGSNPTTGLRLPNGVKHRDRAASHDEVIELLSVLPVEVMPVYATAAYAGLRAGEIQALRWDDIDLDRRRINVSRSWDQYAGEQTPKSKAGTRQAPMPKALKKILAEEKLRTGRSGSDLVFGSKRAHVFTPTNIRKRALLAWKKENVKRAEAKKPLLDPIGLHELRHTAISLWFAAGVRREVCEDWAGHSSGHVTDIYRHLRPEVFDAELALVDGYLGSSKVKVAVGS